MPTVIAWLCQLLSQVILETLHNLHRRKSNGVKEWDAWFAFYLGSTTPYSSLHFPLAGVLSWWGFNKDWFATYLSNKQVGDLFVRVTILLLTHEINTFSTHLILKSPTARLCDARCVFSHPSTGDKRLDCENRSRSSHKVVWNVLNSRTMEIL